MDSVVENGFAELVRQAIKGDQDVLDFFGLEAPLTEDNMKAAAAAALNKFWEMARGTLSAADTGCMFNKGSVSGSPTTFTDVSSYRVYQFKTPASSYSITFPNDTLVDVLVVGGGGGGGNQMSGGGGAGALIFMPGIQLTGGVAYPVGIGAGAAKATGGDSFIGSVFIAKGGGGGGSWNTNEPQNGGSGGGSGACDTVSWYCTQGAVSSTVSSNTVNMSTNIGPGTTGWSRYVLGNGGGQGAFYNSRDSNKLHGGGGGGAGATGGNEIAANEMCSSDPDSCGTCGVGGAGASGISIGGVWYNFSTVFGDAYTSVAVSGNVAGGGGGGGYFSLGLKICPGGIGGGGTGYKYGNGIGTSGAANTGSGGGGASGNAGSGGGGGSGLVLIRVKCDISCGVNAYDNRAGSCIQCQRGSFALSENASACWQCDLGTIFNSSARECQTCNATCPGTVKRCLSNGSGVCCSSGTYFIEGTSTLCRKCDAGKYSINGSAKECNTCPEYSEVSNSSGNSICACDMTIGYYHHDTASNTCLQCPENHYCPAQRRSIPCPTGSQRAIGQLPVDSCQPCTNAPTTGNYTWSNETVCDPQCEAGFYTLDTGEQRFCLNCDKNYTGTSPTCALGMYMPTCLKGSTQKQTCTYCPIPPPVGAAWAVACDFICGAGLYYNATAALCTACSRPTCGPGQGATACFKTNNSVCEICTNAPVSGPYEWVNECTFTCTEATYYHNQTCSVCDAGTYKSSPTNCTNCTTTPCVPGTYRTQCGAVSDSTCAQCPNAPNGLFSWTVACNFTCSNGYYLASGGVCTRYATSTASSALTTSSTQISYSATQTAPKTTSMPSSTSITANSTSLTVITTTPDTTSLAVVTTTTTTPDTTRNKAAPFSTTSIATLVFIQTKTNIALENTVQEVCAKKDRLVLAVVYAMQQTFGVRFSGNLTAINNKTINSMCNNNITNSTGRRLLSSPTTSVQVDTVSAAPANPAAGNVNGNTIIQQNLNEIGGLKATNISTSFDTLETPPATDAQDVTGIVMIVLYVVGGIVVLSALAVIFCCCICKRKTPIGEGTTRQNSRYQPTPPHHHYTLIRMPRIEPDV